VCNNNPADTLLFPANTFSTNNFERGQTDIFEVEGAIGSLRHIYIGHDNTNLAADWHLQVRNPGASDIWVQWNATSGCTSTWPCRFAASLYVGGGEQYQVYYWVLGVSLAQFCALQAVITNSFACPGLDRGTTDKLHMLTVCALQEVIITSPGMPDKQFVANRWLSKNEGDGSTYCNLYPTGAVVTEGPHKYKITVSTKSLLPPLIYTQNCPPCIFRGLDTFFRCVCFYVSTEPHRLPNT